MALQLTSEKRHTDPALWPVICAFTVCLLLWFIDEGKYSLAELAVPLNWIPLGFCMFGLLISQTLIYFFIARPFLRKRRILLSCTLGIPLGILMLGVVFGD